MKRQSLDALVRERVMLTAVDKLNLITTDQRLQRRFATDPQLAFLRNPTPPHGLSDAVQMLPLAQTVMSMRPKVSHWVHRA
jgi:3-polyprenyl-4-hydroxybenzoate decarboxylase